MSMLPAAAGDIYMPALQIKTQPGLTHRLDID